MKILVVEDDMVSRFLLEEILKKLGHEVLSVSNGEKAWEIYKKEKISFVITDWMMPRMNGLQLCHHIREYGQSNNTHYCYIIMLTAMGETDSRLEGLCFGADDFITKPFDDRELAIRIRAGERLIDLDNNLREANEKLEILANMDNLTGLLNRRKGMEVFKVELNRAKRENIPCSIILLDLDNFKSVNDSYGHLSGDRVLEEISAIFKEVSRPYDLLIRWGGDEFLLVFPNTNKEQIVTIAERLRKKIADKEIVIGKNQIIKRTASLATMTIDKDITIDIIFRIIDNYLFKAKRSGRNCVIVSQCTLEEDLSLESEKVLSDS